MMFLFSGFRSRARKCYGIGCAGCDREWVECENPACADYMDVTDWTPWINTTTVSRWNVTSGYGLYCLSKKSWSIF